MQHQKIRIRRRLLESEHLNHLKQKKIDKLRIFFTGFHAVPPPIPAAAAKVMPKNKNMLPPTAWPTVKSCIGGTYGTVETNINKNTNGRSSAIMFLCVYCRRVFASPARVCCVFCLSHLFFFKTYGKKMKIINFTFYFEIKF